MTDPYTTLGLPLDADDAAVRARYLQLTREFPPEQHPERFAELRAAYEKVKDIHARTRYWLFERGAEDTIDAVIEEATCRMPRPRPGLARLLAATKPAR